MGEPRDVAVAHRYRGKQEVEGAFCSSVTGCLNYDLAIELHVAIRRSVYGSGRSTALAQETPFMPLCSTGHSGKSAAFLFKNEPSAAEKGTGTAKIG
jgi:hypothetical protein